MKKENLDNLTEQLENPYVVRAIIAGTLQKTFNRINVGKYNILAEELGVSKENKVTLKELVAHIEADETLRGLYESAINGVVSTNTILELRKQEANKSLFGTVTPYVVEHQQVLANNREFNKIQREGAYLNHLINGLKEHLVEELAEFDTPKYVLTDRKVKAKQTGKEMILCLSDWHIGAYVSNMDTGGYNFSIFKERLNTLLKQTAQTITDQGIKKVHVYHIGDLIEHINMRNVNQAFEAEFPATEQIAKGVRIIVEVLNAIAKMGVEVTFGMVGGNHDRFQGNKNDKIYNDNVAYLAIDQVHLINELGGLHKNIKLIDNRSDVYSFLDTVAGKRIKVTHGDTEGKKVDVKIPKHIKTEVIDYLIMGHIHTTRIIQEDFSRFHVYVGSPMGANNYSAENNLPTTSPAQLIMVIDPEVNSPLFMPVFL